VAAPERRVTILNVDDYAPGLYSRSRLLRQAGFDVREAMTGAEALRLVAAESPDLVLLDVNLPDLDGIEVCRRIKADPHTASVLVLHLSASSVRESDRARALESGADNYLIEPIEPDELIANVRALLRMRRAEETLGERERQLQGILDHTPAVVYMKDRDGRYLLVNREYERLTGFRQEQVSGQTDYEVFRKEEADAFRINDQAVLESGRPAEFEERVTIGGDTRTFLEVKFPVYDAAGTPYAVCAIATDITERKRAEEERERLLAREQAARADAEAANRAKDEFLATVSHELRTPLDAILGWVQVVRAGRRDAATLERALETIERNARVQAELIGDILDVARIVTGRVRLDRQPIDLRPVVEAALDVVRPTAAAKGVQLEAMGLEPGPVSGDPARLQQVVWNLLTNAVKFTPSGGRVTVRLGRPDAEVRLTVSDTGAGIAPDFLPFVFDRFRQAETGTARRHGGLGLGLAIVRHLVELHGGTVEAASPGVGQGATFTVALPRLVGEGGAPGGPAAAGRPAADHRLPGVRVLVVDDENDSRAMLAAVLEGQGAAVTSAGSADEAVAAFERARPDIIVSDIAMPGQDGYSLIRRIRALGPEGGGRTPAVALTGRVTADDRTRALAAGFQAHVAKPIDTAELLEAVAALAGRIGP
jgi:PAS domain S-box-containing protein